MRCDRKPSVGWNTSLALSDSYIQRRTSELRLSPSASDVKELHGRVVNATETRSEMAERALERSERPAVANRYGAIIHEVNNPLEAITNLVYLTKSERDNPAQVLENMAVIEDQFKDIGAGYQAGSYLPSRALGCERV